MYEAALPTQTTAGWIARLELEFAQRDSRTYLAHRRHTGPLVVQRPFFPEPNVCHVYIVHPPGGVVGGDDLTLDVRARPGAHALLTTPAATKFYRCERRDARQRQCFELEDAALEWLPQETIFYPGAQAHSATIVKLSRASRFIGWELPCLGLPARGEAFDRGRLHLDLELWVDDVPMLIDRVRIDGAGAARRAAWGFGGFDAFGTLIAYPADQSLVEGIRSFEFEGVEIVASRVDDVLVCRGLGAQAERIKGAFIAIWQMLRPALLDKAAQAPRIWAT